MDARRLHFWSASAAGLALLFARGVLAGTITVNSTADTVGDDGVCTLREAIVAANMNAASGAMTGECVAGEASPTIDTIAFDIPGSGVRTIGPTSPLPPITEAVVVDGYTQRPCASHSEPCSRANTLAVGDDAELLIELDGTNAGGAAGLVLQSSGSTVRGLVINRFSPEILISGNGSTIAGNFVGTDSTGMTAVSTGFGVDNRGNTSTIGGTTPAARNVFASSSTQVELNGNFGNGGNVVQGNYIGIDAAGTAALSTDVGVHLVGGSVGDTIGGAASGAGNVIANFLVGGVYIEGASNNVIAGNLIGTDATGTVVLTGGSEGIRICNGPVCANNLIGGGLARAGNVVAGAGIAGIVTHGGATGTVILGNRVGTDVGGTVDIGNVGCGILLTSTSPSIVGGTGADDGNVIAFNGTTGVAIGGAVGTSVRGNSIFSNGGLGISFVTRCDIDTAPTPNDDVPGDPDAGVNNLQNFPSLAAGIFPGGTSIDGTFNSTPSTTLRVEVFANDACDASGNGEGQTFVGANDAVMTDLNGDASFTVTFGQSVAAGKVLTATATAPDGSTSEFGPCTASPPPPTTSTSTSTSTTSSTSTSTSTSSTTAPVATTSTTSTTSTSLAIVTTSSTLQPTTASTAAVTTTTSTTRPAGCATQPVGPTFVSIDCRLDDLIAEVTADTALGVVQPKLLDQLQKAKTHKQQAESLCRQASKRRTRKALRPALNKIAQFLRTLKSRKARTIPQSDRDSLRAAADGIRVDMQTLQRTVQCPADAP